MSATWNSGDKQSLTPEGLVYLASSLVVALLMACLAVTLVQVASVVLLEWRGGYLVVIAFLISLEAQLSHRSLAGRRFPNLDWALYRGSEWILLLVGLKLAAYLHHGLARLTGDLRLWQQNFTQYFLDGETIFAILLAVLIWSLSTFLAEALGKLYVDEKTLQAEVQTEEESGWYENRADIRYRALNTVVLVGIGMIGLTALLRTEPVMAWFRMPTLHAGVMNLAIYFCLGLVLFSLTHYLVLQASWRRERLQIAASLAGRWIGYGLLSLVGLGLVAWLLPTTYAISPLAVLSYLFQIAWLVIAAFAALAALPFLGLFALLARLFGVSTGMSAPTIEPPDMPAPPAPGGANPWLEFIMVGLLWGVLLAGLAGSLRVYLRDRPQLAQALRLSRLGGLLASIWTWLSGGLGYARHNLSGFIREGWLRLRLAAQAGRTATPWGYTSLRRMSPRQRVQFYYLALVRRGGEAGYTRRPADTPGEYSQVLLKAYQSIARPVEGANMSGAEPEPPPAGQKSGMIPEPPSPSPNLEQDVLALTGQFVEARYSRHPITTVQANQAGNLWARIRKAFRKL